jgi:hypothetical protein
MFPLSSGWYSLTLSIYYFLRWSQILFINIMVQTIVLILALAAAVTGIPVITPSPPVPPPPFPPPPPNFNIEKPEHKEYMWLYVQWYVTDINDFTLVVNVSTCYIMHIIVRFMVMRVAKIQICQWCEYMFNDTDINDFTLTSLSTSHSPLANHPWVHVEWSPGCLGC